MHQPSWLITQEPVGLSIGMLQKYLNGPYFTGFFGQYLDIDTANSAESVLVQLFFRFRRPESDRLLSSSVLAAQTAFPNSITDIA